MFIIALVTCPRVACYMGAFFSRSPTISAFSNSLPLYFHDKIQLKSSIIQSNHCYYNKVFPIWNGLTIRVGLVLVWYWFGNGSERSVISPSFNIQIYSIYLYRYMIDIWQIYDWYMDVKWQTFPNLNQTKTNPIPKSELLEHKYMNKCTITPLIVLNK